MELVSLRSSAQVPTGVALFERGFRPFFLLAALMLAFWVPLWLAARQFSLPMVGSYFLPTVWHAHEMVFGFAVAVIAGFLLTAAQNWTKRTTARGAGLFVLAGLWTAGRVAPLLGGVIPAAVIAFIQLAFLPVLALTLFRVLYLAKSRRNYGLVVLLMVLFGAQLFGHLGVLNERVDWQTAGPRLGVDIVLAVVLIISGRVVPMFTRNRLGDKTIQRDERFEWPAFFAVLALVVADVLQSFGLEQAQLSTALAATVAGFASAARMHSWGSRKTLRVPLLWVLHAGSALLAVGFALRALAAWWPGALSTSTAIHGLTVGAIAVLCLGMMTRVSLGHTGRRLEANRAQAFAFALIVLSTLLRIAAGVVGHSHIMWTSGLAASAAFAVFVVSLGPALIRPRADGKPG